MAARITCRTCGEVVPEKAKYCQECGSPLLATLVVERRLVSVLFADLVGFTAMAASRDPEDVRETLTQYFELASRIVVQYGGTIEKFIGDAVMAVWGTPVAREDDAERAVRAALELVSAISRLNTHDVDLKLRAGVVTGEAAVTIGARNQGMVAGDTVNTASRLQSVAAPGTVLVDDVTHRASETAISYDDGGSYSLKGKSDEVHAWRALEVAERVNAIVPAFVGRETEARRLQDVYSIATKETSPNSVTLIGHRGVGKTRLVEEFVNSLQTLTDAPSVYWGRASTSKHVALGPVREILRQMAGVDEASDGPATMQALDALVDRSIDDPGIRVRAKTVLAPLLGAGASEIDSAVEIMPLLRQVIEGIAEDTVVVLILDDVQWADRGTTDLLEHIFEWMQHGRLMVIGIAHPEILEEKPEFLRRTRSELISLERLSDAAVGDLVRGIIPELDSEACARLVRAAEGVPLYAVELLRMLAATGVITRSDGGFALSGDAATLTLPETLQSLAASRIDALDRETREVLSSAAVIGSGINVDMLMAVTRLPAAALRDHLTALVRAELLRPDEGRADQTTYSFVQQLIQRVAYDRVAKATRADMHLRAAEHASLDSNADSEEIAYHYVSAFKLHSGEQVRKLAASWVTLAAGHAASLGSTQLALERYEQALDLETEPKQIATLEEAYATMLAYVGREEEASLHFGTATSMYHSQSRGVDEARALSLAAIGLLHLPGRAAEGHAMLQRAYSSLDTGKPSPALIPIARRLAQTEGRTGNLAAALGCAETALQLAEFFGPDGEIDLALVSRGFILTDLGRNVEAEATLKEAHDRAVNEGRSYNVWACSYALSCLYINQNRFTESIDSAESAVAASRLIGDRAREAASIVLLANNQFYAGNWHRSLESVASLDSDKYSMQGTSAEPLLVKISAYRDDIDDALERLAKLSARPVHEHDWEPGADIAVAEAITAYQQGDNARAREAAIRALDYVKNSGPLKILADAIAIRGLTALAAGDVDDLSELMLWVEALPFNRRCRAVLAQELRFRGHKAALTGETLIARQLLAQALEQFHSQAMVLDAALTAAELATLVREDDDALVELLSTEASDLFARLGIRGRLIAPQHRLVTL